VPEDNFLDREIENWRGFRHVLYNDDQEKFVEMMSKARAYAKAAKNAPTKEPAEALFMTHLSLTKNHFKVVRCDCQDRA
jgi:hypothetical protein